jgi:glycosyltransferase involved in cell wall biosynthesis
MVNKVNSSRREIQVGLYIPPLLKGFGGAQKYAIAIMNFLLTNYENLAVKVITEGISVTDSEDKIKEALGVKYRIPLQGKIRFIENPGPWGRGAVAALLRSIRLRKISEDCDLFINAFHNLHYFRGKKNIHLVHFPAERRTIASPRLSKNSFSRRIARHMDFRYKKSYDLFIANSHFTDYWLEKYWNIDNARRRVLYPPTVNENEVARYLESNKNDVILICSRFDPRKNIFEAAEYFINNEKDFGGYTLIIAGSACDEKEKEYLEKIRTVTKGANVEIVISPDTEILRKLFSQAKLFWHCMGLTVNGDENPIDIEHFGMTTVEAMAAGAVPLVIDKGGQKEIVQDGINGYRWLDLKDLGRITKTLIEDDALRKRLANEARERSFFFSYSSFFARLEAIFDEKGLIPEEYKIGSSVKTPVWNE